MTSDAQPVSLVRSPWTETLKNLISLADEHLFIVSPYVKRSATELMLKQLDQRGCRESLRISLITDLRPESTLAGSMDLDAIVEIGRSVPGFELTHLPSVHAKVYVADSRMAIVTSGNLTEAGLRGNVEYGVALSEEGIVKEVRSDFESYASLGARVSIEDVAALSAETEDLKTLFQRAERSLRDRARRAFEEKLEIDSSSTVASPGERKNDPRHLLGHDQIPARKTPSTNRGASPTSPPLAPGPLRRLHRPSH